MDTSLIRLECTRPTRSKAWRKSNQVNAQLLVYATVSTWTDDCMLGKTCLSVGIDLKMYLILYNWVVVVCRRATRNTATTVYNAAGIVGSTQATWIRAVDGNLRYRSDNWANLHQNVQGTHFRQDNRVIDVSGGGGMLREPGNNILITAVFERWLPEDTCQTWEFL